MKSYSYPNTEAVCADLKGEIQAELTRRQDLVSAQTTLMNYVVDERWHWLKQDRVQRTVGIQDINTSQYFNEHKDGFANLFPMDLSSSDGGVLLAVWDFLDAAKSILGEPTISLMELSKCVLPPSIVPTVGQCIFDEVCALLTSMLTNELRHFSSSITSSSNPALRNLDDNEWQDFLMMKPINILTWPAIALNSIHAHCFATIIDGDVGWNTLAPPLSIINHQAFMLCSKASAADNSIVGDIFCLVVSHPLLPFVISTTNNPEGIEQMTLIRNRYASMIDKSMSDVTTFHAYENENELFEDIQLFFLKNISHFPSGSLGNILSRELFNWLLALFQRFSIQVESTHLFNSVDSSFVDLFTEFSQRPHKNLNSNDSDDWFGHFLNPFCVGDSPPFFSPVAFCASNSLEVSGSSEIEIIASFVESNKSMLLMERLRAHMSLEHTLFNLRISDPDAWSKHLRLDVLATLVDRCSQTSSFRTIFESSQQQSSLSASSRVNDVPMRPTGEVSPLETVQFEGKELTNFKCYFSGAEFHLAESGSPQHWVYVPTWLLHPPKVATHSTSASSTSVLLGIPLGSVTPLAIDFDHNQQVHRERPVALEAAVLVVMAAREVALREKLLLEVF